METLITEFFGDIINRILPGAALLGIYPKHALNPLLDKFHDSPTLLVSSLLGIAWVLGFSIERIGYLIGVCIRDGYFTKVYICNNPSPDKLKLLRKKTKDSFWKSVADFEPGKLCLPNPEQHNRLYLLKHTSERIFCRSALVISIIIFIFPSESKPILDIVGKGSRWPGFIGIVLFLSSWLLIGLKNIPDQSDSEAGVVVTPDDVKLGSQITLP